MKRPKLFARLAGLALAGAALLVPSGTALANVCTIECDSGGGGTYQAVITLGNVAAEGKVHQEIHIIHAIDKASVSLP